jgi:hypothetical protein
MRDQLKALADELQAAAIQLDMETFARILDADADPEAERRAYFEKMAEVAAKHFGHELN